MKEKNRRRMRVVRHERLRENVIGSEVRPRLAVYRSGKHIYAQIINDAAGATVAAANSLQEAVKSDLSGKKPVEAARIVGEKVAERAKAAGINSVVFDRGGFKYHGRVKALAEGARAAGLEF